MFSAGPPMEIVQLLYVVANCHRTGAELGLGHFVEFGRGWVTDSSCTRGLVSRPYIDGPQLEELTRPSAASGSFP